MGYHPSPKSTKKPLASSETVSLEAFLYRNSNPCDQNESLDILDLFDPIGLKAAVHLLPNFIYVVYNTRKHFTMDIHLFSHK